MSDCREGPRREGRDVSAECPICGAPEIDGVDHTEADCAYQELSNAYSGMKAERDRLQAWRLRDGETAGAILDLVAPDLHGVNSGDELLDLVRGVIAERDRLRAEKTHLVKVTAALRARPELAERAPLVLALAADLQDAREQRDRLRAVVERQRKHVGWWRTMYRTARKRTASEETERLVADLNKAGDTIGELLEAEAERDRLRAALNHDPLRKSHYTALTDAEDERDRLRAVVRKVWGAWNDATLHDPEQHWLDLTRDEFQLLDATIRQADAKEGT